MDILTHNRIEFRLTLNEKEYILNIPHGAQLDDAIEACGFFTSGLLKLKQEAENKDKEKENDDSDE